MPEKDHTVAVLGASTKAERYSNKAIRLLKEHGYPVIPIHPLYDNIEGFPVAKALGDIHGPVHTLTLYVGPKRSQELADAILAIKPGRFIFNPGTESESLEKKLSDAGVPCLRACTLVLLHTGQF